MVKRYVYPPDGMELVAASDYDALARDLAACKIARDGFTAASDTAHARVRDLEAALREAITQMESDVVFHEYDRGHRSIGEIPDNDLPDALLHARAALASQSDRSEKHD